MAAIDESEAESEQAFLASHGVCNRTGLRSQNKARRNRSTQDETGQFGIGEEKKLIRRIN